MAVLAVVTGRSPRGRVTGKGKPRRGLVRKLRVVDPAVAVRVDGVDQRLGFDRTVASEKRHRIC